MTHYPKNHAPHPSCSEGFSLIEVLVTIVILLIGLLGLAGLQGRALNAQMESYQRAQALTLLKDMADRIDANRANAAAYLTATPRGTDFNGSAVQNCVGTRAEVDLCEWHNALLGAAETQGGGNVGAMIGARGCVYQTAVGGAKAAGEYLVAVAWQGLNSTAVPAIDCGQNKYGNEAKRRVVALPIGIANLN